MGVSRRDQQPRNENQGCSTSECNEFDHQLWKRTDCFPRYVSVFTFVVPKVFKTDMVPGNNKLGFDTFRGYALLNVCFVPMVYFFLIETAGHSLEKIGTWVEDHPKWLVHKDNLSPPFNGGNRPLDEENANPSDEVQVGPSDEAQPRPSGEDQESSGDSDPSVTAPLEEVDLSSWYAR